MSWRTLIQWAEENDREARRLRIIATTDPARKHPALAAAKIHEQRAREYRESARQQRPASTSSTRDACDEQFVDSPGTRNPS